MSDDPVLHVQKLSLELERPQTKDALRQRLAEAAEAFGTTIYLLGVRGALRTVPSQPVQLALYNWPKEWQDQYDARELHRVDPYLRRALSGWGPFRWDEVENLDDKQRAYQAELARNGMAHGMICTFPTLSGFFGMVMFAGMAPIPKATWPATSTALHLFCSAATRAAVYILEKGQPAPPKADTIELSGSERQCLELTAQGYTAEEVGKSLDISPRTVHYHLDRVADKLGVRNKREAVTEALAQGLIHKRHFGPPRFGRVNEQ